jgi:hypothetical protein
VERIARGQLTARLSRAIAGMRSVPLVNRRGLGARTLVFVSGSEYASQGARIMRKVVQTGVLISIFALGAFSQSQQGPEITPANPDLVPQDFTVDDVPISIKVPFEVFVNGKPWQGHTIGWHITDNNGSTMWLGLPGRGMYILSLGPREGYNFEKAGAVRNNTIAFHDGENEYEIRTSGPILGLDRAWNLYMLHLPEREMKGPLFGVDRLGSCTLGFLRLHASRRE